MSFLPVNQEDIDARNWDQIDILFVTPEAYVDHPSFGHAILTRMLEHMGYRVAILSEPDVKSADDFKKFSKPRLAVLISGGVIDSMVNNYSASKHKRRTDCYASDGKRRPDRAVIVYSQRAREAFKDVPIIIGGAEATLRRFAHYDYWQDMVRRSIIFDAKADMISYGMGEKSIAEIIGLLDKGVPVSSITAVKGTAYISGEIPRESRLFHDIVIPSYEEVSVDKKAFAYAFKIQYEEQDPIRGARLIQKHANRYLVCNPMSMPLSTKEMDDIYALPYEREYHPMYEKTGGIKALDEVKFSVTSHRGCFGNCSFCSIALSQGRIVQRRSMESIINEVTLLTQKKDFKGYIHDLSGPTANFVNPSCEKQLSAGTCRNKQCMFPKPCENLKVDHTDFLRNLEAARKVPGVKKVFVRSGIRYDYLMLDKNKDVLLEICRYNISGQLKTAPEHISHKVLTLMGKPDFAIYRGFKTRFDSINKRLGVKQYILPYFISGHPGATIKETIKLTEYLMDSGFVPEQVQDFYPTPGSMSTCMYYTGIDPITGESVYVPDTAAMRKNERILLQFNDPKNRKTAMELLEKYDRNDLAKRVTRQKSVKYEEDI